MDQKFVVALHAKEPGSAPILPFGTLALEVLPGLLAEGETASVEVMNAAAFEMSYKPTDGAFTPFVQRQVDVAWSDPEAYQLVVLSANVAKKVAEETLRNQHLPHLLPENLLGQGVDGPDRATPTHAGVGRVL